MAHIVDIAPPSKDIAELRKQYIAAASMVEVQKQKAAKAELEAQNLSVDNQILKNRIKAFENENRKREIRKQKRKLQRELDSINV